MSKFRRHPKKAVLALLLLVAITAVAAGLAAWLTSNSSQGTFKTGNVAPLTAVADTTGGTGAVILYPGQTADVAVKVSNPNSNPVSLTRWDPNPTGGLSSLALSGNCTQAMFDVPVAGEAFSPVIAIPANASNFPVLLKDAIHMSSTAHIDCAGQTLTTTGTATTAPWKLTSSTP